MSVYQVEKLIACISLLIDPRFQLVPLTDQAFMRDVNTRVVCIGTRRHHQEVAAALAEALEDGLDSLRGLAGDCGQFAKPSWPTHPPMMGVRIGETFKNLGCGVGVIRAQGLVSVLREGMAQGPGGFVVLEVHGARLRFALPD